MISTFLLAQGGNPGGGPSPLMTLMPLVFMVAIFYVMVMRPQQRKEKERRRQIADAKKGQRVVFGGGIFGVIANTKEDTFVVKIADNVKVEILKGAVSQVLEKGAQPADDTGLSK